MKVNKLLFSTITAISLPSLAHAAENRMDSIRSESFEYIQTVQSESPIDDYTDQLRGCLLSSKGCSVTFVGTAPITQHGLGC